MKHPVHVGSMNTKKVEVIFKVAGLCFKLATFVCDMSYVLGSLSCIDLQTNM